MKELYLIGGTMGVGKTTTCRSLQRKLNGSVLLDGDWCWDLHPFQVTEETKTMVMENICFLLNNFIRCTACEHIVFCWVLHQQAIWDDLLSRLHTDGCRVHRVSLTCSEQALRARLQRDVEAGLRTEDCIGRRVARLPLYGALQTQRVDVTTLTPDQAADAVLRVCRD